MLFSPLYAGLLYLLLAVGGASATTAPSPSSSTSVPTISPIPTASANFTLKVVIGERVQWLTSDTLKSGEILLAPTSSQAEAILFSIDPQTHLSAFPPGLDGMFLNWANRTTQELIYFARLTPTSDIVGFSVEADNEFIWGGAAVNPRGWMCK
ncbi:hypothetical protein ACJ72_08674 [Emergomyces africanus]|uniref:Uncharacterized protein n=1 Tax=Emergomyces africanus TaxID=1955775 RepID=A0A1B7NJW3_9EURO|nr:hypothetical protein ACJ72_08674 [Emergomyces africanus]